MPWSVALSTYVIDWSRDACKKAYLGLASELDQATLPDLGIDSAILTVWVEKWNNEMGRSDNKSFESVNTWK